MNQPASDHDMQQLPDHASIARVIRDQRKIELVALGMMVISIWFYQAGSWILPISLIIGIALGLLNHLATEYWLLKVITSGETPTRGQLTRATMIRLCILAVVAVAAAWAFWPNGIGVLLGLAIFRLIALVMTTLPLLKELKNQ
ncbi:ATP synthase subunit I [Nocardioides sp. Iso805N]|uniref:ATP synthase subunit I n=1 Tax=Nocardioides sp. Iso805N TaxID=1283287 RepID=UPI0003741EB6|nr:ATP synthase subunit I [Nocardioides sp. Iso805N]